MLYEVITLEGRLILEVLEIGLEELALLFLQERGHDLVLVLVPGSYNFV